MSSKKIFIVDSTDRLSGTSSDFTINPQPSINSVKSIKLLSAEIPRTAYTVDSTNNHLFFNDGANRLASLVYGYYNTTTLATAILNALNLSTSTAGPFTVNISSISGLITITSTSAISIVTGNFSIHSLLGFTVPTASATTLTGIYVVNLSLPNYYIIDISGYNSIVSSCNPMDYGSFVVMAKTSSGGIDYFAINSDFHMRDIGISNINQLSIRIKKGGGSIINLNGAPVVLVFEITFDN